MTTCFFSKSSLDSFLSTHSSKPISDSGTESWDWDLGNGGRRRREDAGEGGLTGRETIISYMYGYRVAVDKNLGQVKFVGFEWKERRRGGGDPQDCTAMEQRRWRSRCRCGDFAIQVVM